MLDRIEVAAGVVKDAEGRILICRRTGELEGLWEFPGGKMEEGESREVALVREIWEELCVMIMPEKWLCTVEYDYPTFHLTMHCALCRIVQGRVQLNEHLSAQWLSQEELDTVQWLPADVEVVDELRVTSYE